MTTLSEAQVRAIADDVFARRLGSIGFERAQVEARPDHLGDDALFVTLHFGAAGQPISGPTATDAILALEEALKARDDPRFPYLRYAYADDQLPTLEALGLAD